MSLDEKVLNHIKSRISHFTEEEIFGEFPNHTKEQVQEVLFKLQFLNQIKKDNKNQIIYVRKPEEDEKLIFTCIKESSSHGCTMRDLKLATKLPQNLITRILKKLEDKKYIKGIKGQKNKSKVYLLFEQTPDEDVTGGVWFNNGEIDSEFVNQLMKLVFSFVKSRTKTLLPINCNPTIKDINGFIIKSNVLSVTINEADLLKLLDVMVASDILLEIHLNETKMYRALDFDISQL